MVFELCTFLVETITFTFYVLTLVPLAHFPSNTVSKNFRAANKILVKLATGRTTALGRSSPSIFGEGPEVLQGKNPFLRKIENGI